jgi:hypothetical protein
MALQSYGDRDMEGLLDQMGGWAKGNRFEQRAAAAGLCELRLLKQAENSYRVLQILDIITSSIAAANDRKDEAFRVLRQALGYCWSVAVAAFPVVGKAFMEKWMASKDHDVQRIMKDNLSKNRLIKMDADWVERQRLVVD